MTVYLVRHAVAVGRSEWEGPDAVRPLTKKGNRQARGLVDLLTSDGADVRRVLSSPAVRCRDTVAPVADHLGLEVEDAKELAEGAGVADAVEFVHHVAAQPGDSVLCAHGDLVPEIVRRLGHEGMAWDGALRFAKGSTWVLEHQGGQFTAGTYLPPPG